MSGIETLINQALKPIDNPKPSGDLPYATHSGVLHIFGVDLKVFRLSTGQAIIDADDLERFFGDAIHGAPAQSAAAAPK